MQKNRFSPHYIYYPLMRKTITSNTRPKMLTWLCIASFIVGSLWIIMLLAISILSFTDNLKPGLFPLLSIEYFNAGYLFMITLILLAGLGLKGVAMMWNMKKTGVYLYAAAKTLIYFLPVFIIGNSHLTYPALIITSIMITIYGIIFTDPRRNLKEPGN